MRLSRGENAASPPRPHLTLGQIHSALAFYWDHRDEIDADLARREEYVENLRAEMGDSPVIAKLRARGQI